MFFILSQQVWKLLHCPSVCVCMCVCAHHFKTLCVCGEESCDITTSLYPSHHVFFPGYAFTGSDLCLCSVTGGDAGHTVMGSCSSDWQEQEECCPSYTPPPDTLGHRATSLSCIYHTAHVSSSSVWYLMRQGVMGVTWGTRGLLGHFEHQVVDELLSGGMTSHRGLSTVHLWAEWRRSTHLTIHQRHLHTHTRFTHINLFVKPELSKTCASGLMRFL